MIAARYADRRQSSGLKEISSQLTVVDRLVHADIEQFLLRCRIIECGQYGINKIIDMHEVALQRMSISILEQWNSSIPTAFCSNISWHQRFPVWTAEQIVSKRKRMAKIIFFHDPRRPQGAPVDTILDAKLRKHDFLEDFGKRVAARISHMRRALSDRTIVFIEEMPDCSVPSNKDKLLGRGAVSKSLQ